MSRLPSCSLQWSWVSAVLVRVITTFGREISLVSHRHDSEWSSEATLVGYQSVTLALVSLQGREKHLYSRLRLWLLKHHLLQWWPKKIHDHHIEATSVSAVERIVKLQPNAPVCFAPPTIATACKTETMSSRLRSQSNRGLQLLDLLPNVSGALLHTKAWDDDLGGVRWTFASGCVASLIPLCQTAKLSLSQEATMLFQFHSHFLAILRVDSIVDLSKRSTSSTVIQTSQVVAGICIFNRHGHVSACGLVCGPGETRFQQSRAELIGSPQWHKMQNIYISSFKTISYPPAHFRRNRTANIFCIRCIYIYIHICFSWQITVKDHG